MADETNQIKSEPANEKPFEEGAIMGLEEEEEPEDDIEVATTTEPYKIEVFLASFKDVNRDSIEVARNALFVPSNFERLSKSIQMSEQFVNLGKMLERQSQFASLFTHISKPPQPGIDAFLESANRLDGLRKMVEQAIRPSQALSDFAKTFAQIDKIPTLPGISASFAKSINNLTVANSLDTSVARMLAGLSTHESTLASISSRLKQPVWLDIQASSALLEQIGKRAQVGRLLEFGSLERFNAVRLLKSTEVEDVAEDAKDTATVVELVQSKILNEFEAALVAVEPELLILWQGAVEASRTNNPDRARHVAVSLRELTTHLLHILSPDEELANWSTSESDYDNKRPTRRARLRFIFRRFGEDVVALFDLDFTSALKWIELINGQTHAIKGFQTDLHIEALLMRFQGLALSLIQGSRGFPL